MNNFGIFSHFGSKRIIPPIPTRAFVSVCNCTNLFNIIFKVSYSTNMRLFDKAFINGSWVPAKSGSTFQVVDPATCQSVSSVPDMSCEDAGDAIDAATIAFQSWKLTTAKQRSDLLRKWFDLLCQNQDELTKIITLEAGKPLIESLGEIKYGNSFVEWFSEEARRCYGEVIPSAVGTKELVVIRQPIGVVGLITPWNFPYSMITRKAAAALAAGCTCIIKPAEDTPLTALALAHYANQAGIPKGVFNVITCSRSNAADIGKLLCESSKVAGISFTGSTGVGKILYQQCASTVKRISLELGGNAPFIVFKNADLDRAVDGVMASKFRNCGQACISPNRFFIEKSVFNEFIEKVQDKMKSLVVGPGNDMLCNLGPLINEAQVRKVEALVNDAVNKGAKILTGGKCATKIGKLFFEPTLLIDITSDMRVYNEEIFGPVIACFKFDNEQDCINLANNTNSGLAGYFFTQDISQAWRVAKRLEFGMVGINEGAISNTEAPFGGVKESGIGREGSRHGLDEYTNIKYLCFGNLL